MISAHHASTKDAILIHLRKQGSATAQALANQLQVSPQAIRRHLKDLEQEGLIGYDSAQVGMGRPQHVYHLSDLGTEQFPEAYDEFAMGLLNTLAATISSDQLGTILRKQWERKAQDYAEQIKSGPLENRVAALVELRQAEGYMAEYEPVPPHDPTQPVTQYILTEHNCAIAQIAYTFPTVCGHELEMFEAALQNCSVERINWQVNGQHQCGYLISQLSE